MDAFLPSVLDSPVDMLDNSDLVLSSFCSDLKSSDEPVTSNVDLHLECEEDGGSICVQTGSDFYLSHESVGENIQLAISFPNPSASSVPLDDSVSCALCNGVFHRKRLLFKHLKEAHNTEQSYTCNICTYAGKSSKLLSRHKRRMHSLSKDGKADDTSLSAKVHDSTLKGYLLPNKVFLNTSSGKCTVDTHTFTERILSVDRNMFVASDIITYGNASDHKRTTVNKSKSDDRNMCAVNLEIHKSDAAISEPDVTNTNKNTPCDFNISSSHVQTKIDKTFYCTTCAYTATSKRLLKYHINTMHNPQRQLFQCIHCSYTCRQKRTLDLHILKHTGAEIKVCYHCQKKFFSVFALKRHLLIHTDEKQFHCSIHSCLKAFKTAGALGNHKRKVHSMEAEFMDKNVGEDAVNVKCVKKQVKKVMCEYRGCGKTFRDRSNLKTHQYLHSGEKPLKCSLCTFSCVQKTSLDYHKKKCHTL